MTKKTLLLCFIHGFKGSDDTFRNFPFDLKKQVADKLHLRDLNHSDDDDDGNQNQTQTKVESVVYPRYETKGELGQCSEAFLEWLKQQVMEVRKAECDQPWPPNDREVGVVLVAHSMGGFVASDSLFLVLNERLQNKKEEENKDSSSSSSSPPIFPLIQGILTFDTPYNGLARSMFVYGAFSNYQKVSTVFNVMTALSSAAPSALSRQTFARTAASAPTATASRSSNPAWKGWQLVAVRTGTVGAIAAGGVAAYVHRQKIIEGMKNMRNLNRETVKDGVKDGYQQSVDTVSQGLAYINRGNVGKSFEYLSDHFTFVGSLLKQQELNRRLDRLAALKGVGVRDYFSSLGENGIWSGGYFVPERTFCAIPEQEHQAYPLFSRQVIHKTEDEIQAHVNMFDREKNVSYEQMTDQASNQVIRWFNDDSDIVDDPKFAIPAAVADEKDTEKEPVVETTEDGKEVPNPEAIPTDQATDEIAAVPEEPITTNTDDTAEPQPTLPDESPLDIVAAASLVPLPDDEEIETDTTTASTANKPDAETQQQNRTYMRYLVSIAQQAGSYVPRKMPEMPQMPSMSMATSSLTKSQHAIINEQEDPSLSTPDVPIPATYDVTPQDKTEKESCQEDMSGNEKVDEKADGSITEASADPETATEGNGSEGKETQNTTEKAAPTGFRSYIPSSIGVPSVPSVGGVLSFGKRGAKEKEQGENESAAVKEKQQGQQQVAAS